MASEAAKRLITSIERCEGHILGTYSAEVVYGLVASLEEMVAACKCAFIAIVPDQAAIDRFEDATRRAGVKEGFGVRAHDVLTKAKVQA